MRLSAIRIPRRHGRGILIFLLTIVVPVCVLLWLGIQSFDRQREALETLRLEKLAVAIDARTREAAEAVFRVPDGSFARHFFTMEAGELVRPALHAPIPMPLPPSFLEAERHEARRPEFALAAYRRLAADPTTAPLALQRIARTLTAMGRHEEARRTWQELAAKYPDERDPAGRPYGIVAAIQAGNTDGLLAAIASNRWELSADQADYFIAQLGPGDADAYLDRFSFARELAQEFRPPGRLVQNELHSHNIGDRRIFYRAEGEGRIRGFEADPGALDSITAAVRSELGVGNPEARDLRIYVGAVAVVSLMLVAGVGILVRDTAREARTNELRAQFVSGVSHELKTPITLVRLYGETLLRHEGLPEAERRDFYRIITRESARLGRLVDQVLAFSRMERGALRYDMEPSDLVPVVSGVMDDYGDLLEDAGFRVLREIPPSTPDVRFDPAAVAQALINLLDNAVKYSREVREIAVRISSDAGAVAVEVEDQGIGIPPAERSRIFERFYRAHGGTGKGGYGLGLFMVRHIMDAHGGRIEVDSEPGRGSRFRLVFPAVTS